MAPTAVPKKVYSIISKREYITIDELENELEITRTTAKNYLSRLANQNTIKRIGRGLYQIGEGETVKTETPQETSKLAQTIRERFPFADTVTWSLSMLSNYTNYALTKELMFVETSNTLSESIRDYLQEKGYNAILNPTKRDYNEYTKMTDPLVFISERDERYAVEGNTPYPEKIWADIYYLITRKTLNFSPGELGIIFTNMLREEGVNFNRLRRYAQRRGIANEITLFLYDLKETYPTQLPEEAYNVRKGTLKIIKEMTESATE